MSAFPSITPSNISLVSNNPTRITRTLNGIEQRDVGTGQYYSLVATYANLTKAQVRQIMGHMATNSGPLTSFAFALPTYLGTRTGSATSLTTVAGTYPIGSTSVIVTPVGSTPYVRAGDLITFGGAGKVYQVTADANTTTINFRPALRSAISGVVAVNISNVSMNVRYASENQEFAIQTDEYSNFSIEFVEVLT